MRYTFTSATAKRLKKLALVLVVIGLIIMAVCNSLNIFTAKFPATEPSQLECSQLGCLKPISRFNQIKTLLFSKNLPDNTVLFIGSRYYLEDYSRIPLKLVDETPVIAVEQYNPFTQQLTVVNQFSRYELPAYNNNLIEWHFLLATGYLLPNNKVVFTSNTTNPIVYDITLKKFKLGPPHKTLRQTYNTIQLDNSDIIFPPALKLKKNGKNQFDTIINENHLPEKTNDIELYNWRKNSLEQYKSSDLGTLRKFPVVSPIHWPSPDRNMSLTTENYMYQRNLAYFDYVKKRFYLGDPYVLEDRLDYILIPLSPKLVWVHGGHKPDGYDYEGEYYPDVLLNLPSQRVQILPDIEPSFIYNGWPVNKNRVLFLRSNRIASPGEPDNRQTHDLFLDLFDLKTLRRSTSLKLGTDFYTIIPISTDQFFVSKFQKQEKHYENYILTIN